MKLSVDWMGEWVETDLTPEGLADQLTNIGLTVDSVERTDEGVAQVVVARVETVESHPNADRLSVCRVFDGSETVEVVCGAPNVTSGHHYPFAPVGAILPGGLKIKKAKLRGQVSHGMLCSERELELSDEASGLMDLGEKATPGTPLAEHLGLGDTVLEVDVTYNRPDWLSVVGVAREVGAIGGRSLNTPDSRPREAGPAAADAVKVTLETEDDCPLYGARILRGVKIGPSPEWLKRRLEAIGQRSISNVVDVTNYVLHTYGQPIHAFDFGRLRGGEIIVRRATPGERLTTLDDTERTLSAEVLVIADPEGPVALAGIMGGADSEVTDDTVDLLLESAQFDAPLVRDGARSLGMDTEASVRFGRGIDADMVLTALDHTARWIQEVAGGEVAPGQVVAGAPRAVGGEVPLRGSRLTHLLGQPVPLEETTEILDRLGFSPRVDGTGDDAVVHTTVPSWRHDVSREVDLIEEVARFHGYNRFGERRYNESALPAVRNHTDATILRSVDAWVGMGFQEILTTSFLPAESPEDPGRWSWAEGERVPLLNARSREAAYMRTALWPGQLRVAERNLNHGTPHFWLFEHGKIFWVGSDGHAVESWELAGIVRGPLQASGWYESPESPDLYTLKGFLEAWSRRLRLGTFAYEPYAGEPLASGEALAFETDSGVRGRAGRVSPTAARSWDVAEDLWLFSIDFERCLKLDGEVPSYRESSRFPPVKRDLAFVVGATTYHRELETAIRASGGGLVRSVRLFDLYEGDPVPAGKKSMAYSLLFQSDERSLEGSEVDRLVAAIVSRLQADYGATLRDF